MSNLYHKVAVASIGIALGFTLATNKEAKAATLFLRSTEEFYIINEGNPSGPMFTDPTPDVSGHPFPGHSFLINRNFYTDYTEQRGFFEFSISHLSFIKSALFSIQRENMEPSSYIHVEIFGYTGNGRADLSDFSAGESLGSLLSNYPGRINLDVTRFVDERVSNRDAFVGFGIRIPDFFKYGSAYLNRTYYAPVLIVETADVAEPVPEPTTIFGSALALGVGGWLKRKKLGQQSKIKSQH